MKQLVPIYPWPVHPKVAEVLEPIEGITLVEAVPGGPGPVLAIRKAPPFVCDAIVVMEPEKVAQAVDIVIANGLELVAKGDILGRMMGLPTAVTELAPEKVEAKVKFR